MKNIVLIILCMISTAPSYSKKIVYLGDKTYKALPEKARVILVPKSHNYTLKYEQIATITLSFNVNEIGQDEGAVTLLAKKEARKLGANVIVYISGTSYKATEEIASQTYRLAFDSKLRGEERKQDSVLHLADSIYTAEQAEQKRIREFCGRFTELKSYQLLLKGIPFETINKKVGLKEVTRNGRSLFYDIKTGKKINNTDAYKRRSKQFVEWCISFYSENIKKYLVDRDTLMQICREFNDINTDSILKARCLYYYPPLDSTGKSIDSERFKKELKVFFMK